MCYTFDLKTLEIKRKADLHQFRYTFCTVKKDNHIYAIGGRVYGGDDVSLLNKCERYNLDTDKWEEIASTIENRVTAFAFLYGNEIFVIGGYTKQY